MAGHSREYVVEDRIMALATPWGRGALAVVRLSGPGCLEALSGVFSRPEALADAPGRTIVHGWVGREGRWIDEVLVSVFRAPASYTGQDAAEISCHGSPPVIEALRDILRRAGFRDAAPGEFTFRAFAHGKMDLTRAEAVQEIVSARTDRARALAASRLAGSVFREVDRAKRLVASLAAVGALALDYPEEEAEPVPFDEAVLEDARRTLRDLLATWRTGRVYRDGLKVVLAGPANAGKSSLFNLLVREERSIVAESPGTTRDWVESWVSLEGIPLRLFDTAGLRDDARDPVESEGMRRTRDVLASADIVLYVVDGTDPAGAADDSPEAGDERTVRLWNKADAAPAAPEGFLAVSARTGAGLGELEAAVLEKALAGGSAPEGDAPVIDSIRQKTLLEAALAALDRFADGLRDGASPVDLLAEDLREALDALGELTGEVTAADILERLFSEFCVGK